MTPSTTPEPTVQLRSAHAADALCLSVLATQVFLDTYATEGIRPPIAREVRVSFSTDAFERDLAAPDGRITVAERAGHLVGFAQVLLGARHELAPAQRPAELQRLYVQQPFVGQRIGGQLLSAAEQLARTAGCDRLWLTHWVHNHRARAVYLHRGYTDLGASPFVFEGESHENRVMARWL